jgi:hypothetical protein
VVFIVIGVQKDLNEIKSALRAKGYEVVDVENYNYPIDAVVYEGNSFQISCVSSNNMPTASMGNRNNYGVLMINSLGKSMSQIEEMLKMRGYSQLF